MIKLLKKLILFTLVLCLLLSSAGCGLPETAVRQPETAPAAAAAGASPATEKAPEPAVEATPEPTPEPTPAPTDAFIPVGINEVMASNKGSVRSPSGDFCDWVELYNYGTAAVDLSGYGISTGDSYCPLGSRTLQPGEYLVVYCTSVTDGNAVYADCSISRSRAFVSLVGQYGTVIESITVTDAESDTSYYRDESGSIVSTRFPTPGFENTSDGYSAWQETLSVTGPLIINEAASYNNTSYMYGGQYYDWVELKNISDTEVRLSDYYLSDSKSDLLNTRLSDLTLRPGQVYYIYCSGDPSLSFSNGGNAGFALSADSDHVFLSTADGTIVDSIYLHDIPYQGSMGRISGRSGTFYFTSPTPNAENGTGCHCFADKPVLLCQDGIYNNVDSVTVSLSGTGTIYYTTNGSTPTTSSSVYTGPFELTKTTPIRAICVEDGKLASEILNASFIINENHTLPVVNVMADYNAMFGNNGVYTNPYSELECLGAVTFYENGGSFEKICGIKLHGATSKVAQEKKSMKLCFRSRYDGELEYDLFGNGVTEFADILVRAAQEDYYSTLMRDTLMHQVAVETFPALPSQDNKYAVLYINGEYWGVYDIREAHSPEHYANHYGYDADTVEQWKFQWPSDHSTNQLYNFIMNYDLTDPANWAEVKSRLDITSVADWSIIQAYCGNFDCNPDNVRFYYSTEDDKMVYALVDLDLGFFSYDMFDTPYATEYAFQRLATRLLKNPEYRQLLTDELYRALTTTLSNESMLQRIDDLEQLLLPEISRDRARWGGSLEKWQFMVEELRGFVNNNVGRARLLVISLKNKIGLTDAQVEEYFSEIPTLPKNK